MDERTLVFHSFYCVGIDVTLFSGSCSDVLKYSLSSEANVHQREIIRKERNAFETQNLFSIFSNLTGTYGDTWIKTQNQFKRKVLGSVIYSRVFLKEKDNMLIGD